MAKRVLGFLLAAVMLCGFTSIAAQAKSKAEIDAIYVSHAFSGGAEFLTFSSSAINAGACLIASKSGCAISVR